MKRNNFQSVSDSELDHLFGMAFLDLDFNAPVNDKLLTVVAEQAMHNNPIARFFNRKMISWLFLLLALLMCLSSLAEYLEYMEAADARAESTPVKPPLYKPLPLPEITDTKPLKPVLNIHLVENQKLNESADRRAVKKFTERQNNDKLRHTLAKPTESARDTVLVAAPRAPDSTINHLGENIQNVVVTSVAATSSSRLISSTSIVDKQAVQQKRSKKAQPVKTGNKVKYAVRKKSRGGMKKGRGVGPFNWFKNKRNRSK